MRAVPAIQRESADAGPSERPGQHMFNALFDEPWWLTAVAPGQWGAVEIERGGQVVARLPYVIRRRLGVTALTMPPLTPRLGPWLAPSNAKPANQLAHQKDLMTELIQGLPPHHYFLQHFHYAITNWLPFHWQGFEQTTRYTYVLDNLSDLENVWAGLLVNIRTDIRKAQKQVQVRTDLDLDRFLEISSLTFARQGEASPYSRALVERVDAACAARGVRRMFFAEDAQGRIHAAIYLVWDSQSAYYLLGGGDPALRNSGATSLVLWEAINFAATVTQRFDFEGSMLEPVERFFRAFGARQVPYFRVTRAGRLMRLALAGRQGVGALLGRGAPT
ncbi:MAG: GNAT family N-acetyltransferase [Gemmatimonadaceae bacterium]